MGTVEYMSPEQAEDTRAADQRSDIYSLGCTLFRLITGQSPFARDTVVKTILAHREAPIPLMATGTDPGIVQMNPIFQRMVAKNPDDRYPNITALLQDLRQLQDQTNSSLNEATINTIGLPQTQRADQPTMTPGSTSPNSGYSVGALPSNPPTQPISGTQPTLPGSQPTMPMQNQLDSQGMVFTDSSQQAAMGQVPVSMPHGISNPQLIGIKHHRGKTIMVMGVCSLAFLGCLFGFPLGIVTWVFANSDLDEMRRGMRDASGMTMTKTGKVLGQITVAIGILMAVGSVIGGLID